MDSGRSKAKFIGIVLIGLNLFGVLISLFIHQYHMSSAIGLSIIAGLCYCLFKRKEWAGTALAVLISISAIFRVLGLYDLFFMAPLLALWSIINVSMYIVVIQLLLFDDDVKRYVRSATYQES